jgi:hypothetical protein
MRFIKEYKVFEGIKIGVSDDNDINRLNFKIRDILKNLLEEFTVRIDTTSSNLNDNIITVIDIHARNFYSYRATQISSQLERLQEELKPRAFLIHAIIPEANGMSRVSVFNSTRDLIEAVRYLNNIRLTIITTNKNRQCVNPECDNVLDAGADECPVCGEKQ